MYQHFRLQRRNNVPAIKHKRNQPFKLILPEFSLFKNHQPLGRKRTDGAFKEVKG